MQHLQHPKPVVPLPQPSELQGAPSGNYATLQAKGHGLEDYKYRMQV